MRKVAGIATGIICAAVGAVIGTVIITIALTLVGVPDLILGLASLIGAVWLGWKGYHIGYGWVMK